MPSIVRIRPCRQEECPAVLKLWREADATPSATDYLDELTRFAGDHEDFFLVAEEDDQIVGTILVGWDGWRANIYRLAVLPECRLRGIARSMVKEAERRLLARGARRLSILVEQHDARAVAFWDALANEGYELDPRMVRYVKTLEQDSA